MPLICFECKQTIKYGYPLRGVSNFLGITFVPLCHFCIEEVLPYKTFPPSIQEGFSLIVYKALSDFGPNRNYSKQHFHLIDSLFSLPDEVVLEKLPIVSGVLMFDPFYLKEEICSLLKNSIG